MMPSEQNIFLLFFTITPREIRGYFLATIKFRVATNLEFLQKITNYYYQNLIKDPDSLKKKSFVFTITPRKIRRYFLATINLRVVTNLDFRKSETIF